MDLHKSLTKDPDADLDYGVDWTPFLDGTNGDTIATAELVVQDGLTVVDEGLDGAVHMFTASGGTVSEVYKVTSRVTTVQGRTDDKTVLILVVET